MFLKGLEAGFTIVVGYKNLTYIIGHKYRKDKRTNWNITVKEQLETKTTSRGVQDFLYWWIAMAKYHQQVKVHSPLSKGTVHQTLSLNGWWHIGSGSWEELVTRTVWSLYKAGELNRASKKIRKVTMRTETKNKNDKNVGPRNEENSRA